jgi:hypothetical protein
MQICVDTGSTDASDLFVFSTGTQKCPIVVVLLVVQCTNTVGVEKHH